MTILVEWLNRVKKDATQMTINVVWVFFYARHYAGKYGAEPF